MHSFDDFNNFLYEHLDTPCAPHLYTLTRMGCNLVSNSFKITRDASYTYHALHYVYCGKGLLTINQKHYKLAQGSCFILGPGKPHLYASDEMSPLGLIWIEFFGSNTADLLNIILSKHIHVLHLPYTEIILSKLVTLLHLFNANQSPNPLVISEQLYSFIIHVIDQALLYYEEASHLFPILPPHIQYTLTYIDTHFQEKLKITDLAKLVKCSPSYLSRTFSTHLGVSPYQYILVKKIEYALLRLLTENATASELAEELGFVDTTHFTKVFKRITGKNISNYKMTDKNY